MIVRNNSLNVKILVATHKNYEMPEDKDLYLPIMVGRDIRPDVKTDFLGDNIGDNISNKNGSYNELTAIYWAWKNLNVDAIGLVHYRRYLSLDKQKNLQNILDRKQIEKLLNESSIVLPKKRNYVIQTNYEHYVHAHHALPLDKTKEIISQYYPDYLSAFETVMRRRSAHMFNMFVMKNEKFNEYCTWMFDVLGKLEGTIDISRYDSYEGRVFGFVSELLLDVWIYTKGYSYKEVNLIHIESQHWLKKGSKFIGRMFIKPKD